MLKTRNKDQYTYKMWNIAQQNNNLKIYLPNVEQLTE